MQNSSRSFCLKNLVVAQLVGALLFIGATASASDSPSVFSWQGNPGALTTQEWIDQLSDRQYVQSLAPANTSVRLNLADPRQFRFVINRLKIMGKTPLSAPELFRRISQQRSQDIQSGYKEGTIVLESAGSRQNSHAFSSGNYFSDVEFESIAFNTRVNSVPYESVDSAAWSASGDLVSGMGYSEGYNVAFTKAATRANVNGNDSPNYTLDSVAYIDDGVNFFSLYTYREQKGRERPNPTISVTAPANRVGDQCVDICLNRTWTGDCDYDLTGTQTALKIPFAGSATLNNVPNSNGYYFDVAKINAYKAGTAVPQGFIKVVLTVMGGGCDASTLYAGMRAFWNSVTLSDLNGDGSGAKTLTWDATGANSLLFDSSCRQVQNQVLFTAHVVMPGFQGGPANTADWYIDVTNDPSSQFPKVPCITITNSCFAEGSLIAMENGNLAPIESVKIGDRVANPHYPGAKALTVMDVAKGTESVPMVRIQDEAGRSLLLTEMHPMPIVNKGMVQARRLVVGDQVFTRTGASRLVRVERVAFNGKVYNLKVGSDAEVKKLGQDQTVVYANGILIGDGQLQAKYELREMTASAHGNVLKQLPKRWHKDYVNSAHRKL